jgi:uncharacterized protein
MLQAVGAFGLSGTGFGGYALAIEPYRMQITRYAVSPGNWPKGLKLKIAAIADIHVCEPWMPASRVEEIVAATNALEPDLIVLLGDFVGGHRLVSRLGRPLDKSVWTPILADLKAPLGRYAVLGNHDWWENEDVQIARKGPTQVGRALEAAGIPVFENDAIRLTKDGHAFWLGGLGDQWAFYNNSGRYERWNRFNFGGVDDLPATLSKITDDAPIVMMIHEPDAFAEMPDRVALTMAGHTHGGQVQLFGFAPIVPSRFGRRYLYGHIVENGRHLVVSGGLGCSALPVRFGRPPEIVEITVEA